MLRQNIDFVDLLFSSRSQSNVGNPFNEFITNFHTGQWVDVKDTIDQWLEGQITKVKENKVFVHYNGWGSRWDEWVETKSQRLNLFRTHTVQLPSSNYASPYPNLPPDPENHEIVEQTLSMNQILNKVGIENKKFALW